MNKSEAATLIRKIAESLRDQPDQFNIQITNAGYVANNSGGMGFVAQNTGGTGFHSNMGGANIQIANNQARGVVDEKLQNILRKLDEIVEQLQLEQPCTDKLQKFANDIYAEKWLPSVIVAVITTILDNFT